MYCYECEEFFDEPKAQRELMGECCGQPAYDTFWVCPECGSHDIEDGHPCDICGEPARKNDRYCECCIGKARRYLNRIVDHFMSEGAEEGDALDLIQYAIEES